MSTLRLHRQHDAGGLLRRLSVLVDGEQVAALRPGQEAAVTIRPGAHTVQAKMDWTRSAPLRVEVADGQSVSIEVAVPLRCLWEEFYRPSKALDARVLESAPE